jgi:hypothetical protein
MSDAIGHTTVPSGDDADTAATQRPPEAGTLWRPNRLAWTAIFSGGASALTLLSLGPWTVPLMLLLASLAIAVSISPNISSATSSGSAIARVPVSFIGVLVAVVLIGLVGSLLDLQVWNTPLRATIMWLLIALLPLIISWRRGGHSNLIGSDGPAAAAFFLTMGYGIFLVLQVPFPSLARIVNGGTDFGRHLAEYLGPIVEAGNVFYFSNGYPVGLHALVGSPLPAFGDASYRDAWIALEGTAWLLVVLSATALAWATSRATREASLGRPVWRYSTALIVVVIFLQTAVLDSFLRYGFVTSLLALLVVCTATATALGEVSWRESIWQFGLLSVAMAHSWQLLLPVVAVPLLAIWAWSLIQKSNRIEATFICLVAGLASLPSVLPLLRSYVLSALDFSSSSNVVQDVSAIVSTPGSARLLWPGAIWLLTIPLLVVALLSLWRNNKRRQVTMWCLLSFSAVAIVLSLWFIIGTSSEIPYFVLKSVWTLLPILLPLTAIGGAILFLKLLRLTNMLPTSSRRVGHISLIAALVLGTVALVGGQWAGDRPTIARLTEGPGAIAYQIPVITALEQGDIALGEDDSYLFWGLAPTSNTGLLPLLDAGFADQASLESGQWIQSPGVPISQLRLPYRDVEAVCDYLRQNPATVRITGPNPEPGIQWLLDSGCPKKVVRPNDWSQIDIEEKWFEGREELLPFSYPTWEEAEKELPSPSDDEA